MQKKYEKNYPTKKNILKSKSVKKNLPEELIDTYQKELSDVLNINEINDLKNTLNEIYESKDSANVHIYMTFVLNEIRSFHNQKQKINFDLQLANKIYNQFSQSNDFNIMGSLLVANMMKFNKIIEQNDEIINSLNK